MGIATLVINGLNNQIKSMQELLKLLPYNKFFSWIFLLKGFKSMNSFNNEQLQIEDLLTLLELP